MPRSLATWCALLLLAGSAQAGVYRCEVEGRKVYLDRPCKAGDQPHELPKIGVMPSVGEADLSGDHDAREARLKAVHEKNDAEWLKQHAKRRSTESQMNAAAADRRVVKDMSADQVRRSLGSPDEVKRKDGVERWTYEDGKKRRTVVLKDGKVTGTGAGKRP